MIASALLLSAGIVVPPTGVRGRRSFAWRNPLSPTAESVHRKVREKMAEKIKIACRVWTLLCLAAHCRAFAGDATGSARQAVSSPDGRLELAFESDARGMRWSLARDGRTLVRPSRLGVLFAAANPSEEGSERLAEMKIAAVTRGSSDTTWKTTLSRRGTIRDRHNEMTVELVEAEPRGARVELGSARAEKTPRRLGLVFRAYDEGVAFRYAFPQQEAFDGFVLKDEQTEWNFGEGTSAWVAPYETGVAGSPPEGQFAGEYVRLALAALDPGRFVGQPVLVEAGRASLALCEAALSNWAGLHYRAAGNGKSGLRASLAKLPPSPAASENISVIAGTPAQSPWRVTLVGDDDVDLLRKNDVLLSLNPPPDPAVDFSFVKPGVTSWDWWVESNNSLSTGLTLKLVDFAAEMGWPYHTIDGGWFGFARRPNHGPNVPLEPRKGFDLARIVAHAKARNVGIWVWIHWMEIESIGLEETFARLSRWGVVGVKADFVERLDQEMVNWCEKLFRTAAKHRIMVNLHGSFNPIGGERTWPNLITREAICGNEMNIFKTVTTPEHCAVQPFTRFLTGPADFTPGSFANVFSKDFTPQLEKGHRYGDETDRCPNWAEEMGTRAHALAQCVQFDSPLMTLCDWPERYRGAAGIEVLRSLPTTWRDTRPLEGRCGEYYAVLRESFGGRFYYAATTVKPRDLELSLDFLGDDAWKMIAYVDDKKRTPLDAKAVLRQERTVRKGEKVRFELCPEGGAVALFVNERSSGR